MFKKKVLLCLYCFSLWTLTAGASPRQQVRLGVMPFLSRTRDITANQASQVTDVIIRILHVSPSISVIERERLRVVALEQGLGADSSDQASALKIGQLAGCEYILLGSVTQLTQRYLNSTKYTQFLFDSLYDSASEMQESTAKLEARLIDVATGRVVLSFSQAGSAVISSEDGGKSRSKNELAMRAIEAASSRLCDKIREVIAEEHAMVIAATKKNIRINRGRASGVSPGAFYRVYEEGEEVFDLNGSLLGKKSKNIALLRVIDTASEFSSVEVLNGPALQKPDGKKAKKADKNRKPVKSEEGSIPLLIREGDRIEAITRTEADDLMKKAKFPTSRN